jgi:hypothetical protein
MTNKRTGDGKNNGKGKDKIQGSLYCAAHGETVRSFGRDDVVFVGGGRTGNRKDNRRSLRFAAG